MSVIGVESFVVSSPDLLRSVLDLADQAMARAADHDETVRREFADFIMRNGPAQPQLP